MTSILEKQPLSQTVQRLNERFKRLWWETDSRLPPLGQTYGLGEQIANDRMLKLGLDELTVRLRHSPRNESERMEVQRLITQTCMDFAAPFGFEGRHFESLERYRFSDAAVKFAQMARDYDPELNEAEIFQASRNAWSMHLMQIIQGQPVKVTPAVFAYSLLYPYSDNLLDDPSIDAHEKQAFNRRFQRRLMGETVIPASAIEEKINDLIGMIEDQLPRWRYPQVYESLLAILEAQSRSTLLLQDNPSPYEVDVLGICFEKGGASVLADGYLLLGDLDEAQQEFMYFYGTLTQLVDDLEDVQKDHQDGLMTVFSQTAGHWPLDAITNRTFHYAMRFADRMDEIAAPDLAPLCDMIRRSLPPLFMYAAANARQYYTREYISVVQSHFPYRIPFLEKQQKKLARQGASGLHIMEAFAATGAQPWSLQPA